MDKDAADRVLSQLKRVIRTNYSNPPTHGGAVVAAVLGSPELRATWETELGEMRDRIRSMRHGLVARLQAAGVERDFSFVNAQRGMFSYSGLTAPQVDRLREEFGIYAVGTGRICVAALNTRNLDAVANAVAIIAPRTARWRSAKPVTNGSTVNRVTAGAAAIMPIHEGSMPMAFSHTGKNGR